MKTNQEIIGEIVMESKDWDGEGFEGIPPVGTVCEHLSAGGEWRKCEIVAYYFANVVAVDVLDSYAVLKQPMMFRPIKTPEQLAAEERLLVIDEMWRLLAEQGKTLRGYMGVLYDAGYRKVEV